MPPPEQPVEPQHACPAPPDIEPLARQRVGPDWAIRRARCRHAPRSSCLIGRIGGRRRRCACSASAGSAARGVQAAVPSRISTRLSSAIRRAVARRRGHDGGPSPPQRSPRISPAASPESRLFNVQWPDRRPRPVTGADIRRIMQEGRARAITWTGARCIHALPLTLHGGRDTSGVQRPARACTARQLTARLHLLDADQHGAAQPGRHGAAGGTRDR